ncbi:MAG: hypothetical protein WCH52_02450 [Bacteroidota bacterium]
MSFCKLIFITVFLMIGQMAKSQDSLSLEQADAYSYQLYLNGNWDELLSYGKKAIETGHDFTYLRLRMGYAAVIKKNYSEALKHYNHILDKDKHNETARYFVWYCREFLNQSDAANYNVHFFSKENINKENLKKYKIKSTGIETSIKSTNDSSRGNSYYTRAFLTAQLGWRLTMSQSAVIFNQQISDKFLTKVERNDSILIHQKEYYNLITYNIDHHLQFKAAYHYLYTPFNNIVYYNHLVMLAMKYYSNYVNIQGSFIFGKMTDGSFKQFDIQADYYPSGNLGFYASSNISFRQWENDHQINFKQVVGFKVNKKLWIEANTTIGKFSNHVENDGLYVYNAVDPNLMKSGMTLYYSPTKKMIFQLGALIEKRESYYTNYIFNQQSINGGVTWKF